MLAAWSSGDERDIQQEMTELTMHIASRIFFASRVKEDAEKIGKAVDILQEETMRDYRRGFLWPLWAPLPSVRRRNRARRLLDNVVADFIREGREDSDENKTLLSVLMRASAADDQPLTSREIQDEVLTLFLVGHETVSSALSWTWYEICRNPEIESRPQAR